MGKYLGRRFEAGLGLGWKFRGVRNGRAGAAGAAGWEGCGEGDLLEVIKDNFFEGCKYAIVSFSLYFQSIKFI